jgi:hypothetical protein
MKWAKFHSRFRSSCCGRFRNTRSDALAKNRHRTFDVRLIAATNCNLAHAVKERRLREDLYYRLNVVELAIPPLRERPEDLRALADSILVRVACRMGRQISGYPPYALEQILRYPWPGNTRELENVIERACVLAAGNTVNLAALPAAVSAPATATLLEAFSADALSFAVAGVGNDAKPITSGWTPQHATAMRSNFVTVTYGSDEGELRAEFGPQSELGPRMVLLAPGCGVPGIAESGSSLASPFVAASSWLRLLLDEVEHNTSPAPPASGATCSLRPDPHRRYAALRLAPEFRRPLTRRWRAEACSILRC